MLTRFQALVFATCALMCPFIVNAGGTLETLQPALISITPDHIFAPMGFDDNDNAQVVLDGELSDTCHKLGPTSFKIDEANQRIYVQQQAYYYPGAWCAQVRVPYVQTLNLGLLRAGQYEIVTQREDGTLISASMLPVAAATTLSPDDHLYAPVTDVFLEKSLGTLEGQDVFHTLFVSGSFNNSCMKFKEMKMIVRDNNVIEILPLVEMDKTGGCSQLVTEFNVGVSLKSIPKGRHLIHIRSLNGQSINRVADL